MVLLLKLQILVRLTNPWILTIFQEVSSGGSAAATIATNVLSLLAPKLPGLFVNLPPGVVPPDLNLLTVVVPVMVLIAMASSTDSPGPIAKNIEMPPWFYRLCLVTIPMMLLVLRKNPWLLPSPLTSLKGLKLGLPKAYFPPTIKKEVKEAVLKAIEIYKKWVPKLSNWCSRPQIFHRCLHLFSVRRFPQT